MLTALAIFNLIAGHPGESHDADKLDREMKIRAYMAEAQARELGQCEGSFDAVARTERAIERRTNTVQRLREERGLTNSMSFR